MSRSGVYSTGLLVPSSNVSIQHTSSYDPRSPAPLYDCVQFDYDVPLAIVCAICFLFGIIYSFCGYRCFKLVMFLTGFIFGSVIVYLICVQEHVLPSYGNVSAALVAGVLFGLITMLIQYVGLFMTGLHTGLLTGLGALVIADHMLHKLPTSIFISLSVLMGAALLFAVLNLHWIRALTILGTAVYGGAIMSASTDYFVERWIAISWLWDRATLRPVVAPPCWLSWFTLGIWPTVVALGVLTQCVFTGRGIHHRQPLGMRKKARGNHNMQRARTREERAELRQKKYRYLYQVRTAHGDVISQSYVKSLREKRGELSNGGGECSTLQSDATHVTILPDSQLAALTESEDDIIPREHGAIVR